ncbi:MAG: cyclopropane-fatty-acyl-phospholipid synthase family protein [Planctomycetota bacterium]
MTFEILRPESETRDRANLSPPRFAPIARVARRLVHDRLRTMSGGRIRFVDALGVTTVGRASDLDVEVRILDLAFYRLAAFGGALGVAESYLRGHWDADDLTALFRIFARDGAANVGLEGEREGWRARFERWRHARRRNTPRGSRRNIAAHYDLSNEFFALFLDPTMMYSAGVFRDESTTMEEASVAKVDLVCRKLELGPEHRLLEIGTGWGYLAIHAAENYGCRVVTTTISRRQHEVATRRVRERGLEDRIEVRLEDYRDLRGTFDRVVSIEMIEAVGAEYWGRYYEEIAARLAPGGLALVQAITIRDEVFERARREIDFIKRYVFPGCCIPSLGALEAARASAVGLDLVGTEDIGPHYATTLRHWRRRFLANAARVRELGFDDRFKRLWEYYLRYCEAGFAEGHIGDHQLLYRRRPGPTPAAGPAR